MKRNSPSRMALFFIPLVLMSVSQSLTYPFVASIVSHGAAGVDELSAYAMGQSAMFLLGSVGAGMITTGMMFVRSRAGFRNYQRLNFGLGMTAGVLMLSTCLPGPDRFVFGSIYGLGTPGLIRIARNTLLLSIPLQLNFFVRNPFMARLLLARRSDLLNIAMFVRVGIACVFAALFVRLGWTGYAWGALAMTIPSLVETSLHWFFSSRYGLPLPENDARQIDLSVPRQLRFTLPLSLGGILMWATAIFDYFFLMRSGSPGLDPAAAHEAGLLATSLHVLVIGIANPLALAGLQMQSVAISFAPSDARERRNLALFAASAGLSLAAAIAGLASFDAPARWYFCTYQNLAPEHLSAARALAFGTAILPFLYVFMGRANGLAANAFKSRAILAGQTTYFFTMLIALALCFTFRLLPGCAWGVFSIACGIVAATCATTIATKFFRPSN